MLFRSEFKTGIDGLFRSLEDQPGGWNPSFRIVTDLWKPPLGVASDIDISLPKWVPDGLRQEMTNAFRDAVNQNRRDTIDVDLYASDFVNRSVFDATSAAGRSRTGTTLVTISGGEAHFATVSAFAISGEHNVHVLPVTMDLPERPYMPSPPGVAAASWSAVKDISGDLAGRVYTAWPLTRYKGSVADHSPDEIGWMQAGASSALIFSIVMGPKAAADPADGTPSEAAARSTPAVDAPAKDAATVAQRGSHEPAGSATPAANPGMPAAAAAQQRDGAAGASPASPLAQALAGLVRDAYQLWTGLLGWQPGVAIDVAVADLAPGTLAEAGLVRTGSHGEQIGRAHV